MLSDSLDPDQDLQSGFKLFTWYDVCCNIRGGIEIRTYNQGPNCLCMLYYKGGGGRFIGGGGMS